MKIFFTPENNQKILRASAYYCVLWGFIITFVPQMVLRAFNVELLFGIEFWQFFGMVTGVIGIGFFITSSDPGKYWPIVFVGFLGFLMSTFVFAKSLASAHLPFNFALVLLMSSVIWIVPFYYILLAAYEENTLEFSHSKQFHDLINHVRTSENKTLFELSQDKKVLLVVIRHFGCTFCRELVDEMSKIEKDIADKNYTLVYVHMSDPGYGDEFFTKYYQHPVHHISDPGRIIYKSLNLKRGTFYQIFGAKTWIRSFYAGVIKGHGVGEFEGDILQLGGVFILSRGHVIYEQKAKYASHIIHFNTLPEL